MDQTFNFCAAPVPLHRRLSPRTIALVVTACIALFALGSFSRWVIDSERRSIARAERAETSSAIIGTISGSDDASDPASPVADRLAIDATARADARVALDAARRAAAGRATFIDAGPGQLSSIATAMILVDGPSHAPGIVSVSSTRDSWGAAVMGPSGTCYLLRFSPADGITYGTGRACTGVEALAAAGVSW